MDSRMLVLVSWLIFQVFLAALSLYEKLDQWLIAFKHRHGRPINTLGMYAPTWQKAAILLMLALLLLSCAAPSIEAAKQLHISEEGEEVGKIDFDDPDHIREIKKHQSPPTRDLVRELRNQIQREL